MTVHQIVAGFHVGDAISNETLLIAGLLSAHGVANDIYCPRNNIDKMQPTPVKALDGLENAVKPDDIALLHLSIGSAANLLFPKLRCRRIILYHNITPAFFLERLNPSTAQILANGRNEVALLKDAADAVYADSAFNASELAELGYKNPKVLPLVIDDRFGSETPDPGMMEILKNGHPEKILFVGRIAPNKRQDRLVTVFAHYRNTVNPNARLLLIGDVGAGMEAYHMLVLGIAHSLEVRDAIFSPGFVTAAELAACYASADAFVCCSDHEGFCAPLLEAMAWHVPVFAIAAGAVPETLDGAGVLVDRETPPEEFAEIIGKVLHDPALRASVIRHQDERLARFRARNPWHDVATALGLPL